MAARLVKAPEAAAYLGIPLKEFERQRIGQVQFGKHLRYDLRAIDAHLNRLSGLQDQQKNGDGNAADLAFERSAPKV